jgi:hypothetical protein
MVLRVDFVVVEIRHEPSLEADDIRISLPEEHASNTQVEIRHLALQACQALDVVIREDGAPRAAVFAVDEEVAALLAVGEGDKFCSGLAVSAREVVADSLVNVGVEVDCDRG